MSLRKQPFAVTMGDPYGIGPEIILRSFLRLPALLRRRLVLFGNLSFLRRLNRRLGCALTLAPYGGKYGPHTLPVVSTSGEGLTVRRIGLVDDMAGRAAMKAVEAAADRTASGEFCAMITAPINKESVNRAGYAIPGHTEFLANRSGADVAMMLASKELSVVVATTHAPLRDVPGMVTTRLLLEQMRIIDRSLKQYGVARPRIALAALNPHASDGGLFGDEEEKIFVPAIAAARSERITVSGPYPADTLFTAAMRKKYDVALCSYHDQGLIPIKALSFGKTVNVTLGLPYLRVSVDHGVAFDIAGTGIADIKPMLHAVRTADHMLKGRL